MIKIFIEEHTIINNKVLDQKITIKPFMNNIIKLLIRNGLSITEKSNVNSQIKKLYKDYTRTKFKFINTLNIFIPDIANLICQY